MMFLNKPAYSIELRSTKASCLLEAPGQARILPPCFLVSHGYGRFTAVKGNKEETVRAYPQDRRHIREFYLGTGSAFNRTQAIAPQSKGLTKYDPPSTLPAFWNSRNAGRCCRRVPGYNVRSAKPWASSCGLGIGSGG